MFKKCWQLLSVKLNKIEPTTCEIEQYMGANREKYGSFHSLISGLGEADPAAAKEREGKGGEEERKEINNKKK